MSDKTSDKLEAITCTPDGVVVAFGKADNEIMQKAISEVVAMEAALAEKDAEIKKLQEENRILLTGIATIVDFSRWSLNVMDDSIAKIKGVSKPEDEEKDE